MEKIKTNIFCNNRNSGCDGIYNVVSDLEEEVPSAKKGDAMWQDTLLLKCPKCGHTMFAPKSDFTLVNRYTGGNIDREYRF